MNIDLHPQKIFKGLLFIILFLLCMNVLGILSKFYFDKDSIIALVPFFDFNTERNIPTLFSSLIVLFSSILLLGIALAHKKQNASYLPWIGLAIIFIYLGIDEAVVIHEEIGIRLKEIIEPSGLFFYTWVIPYGILLIIFLIAYLKFLFRLPRKFMLLFIISGSTFIAGALGFEVLSARHAYLFGIDNLTYSILYTFEETFEMLGIAIFIFALSKYIVSQYTDLTITLSDDKKS